MLKKHQRICQWSLELNDSALEFDKACGNLAWIHCISNTQIRDKCEFRKSIEQSRKKDICGAVAIRFK